MSRLRAETMPAVTVPPRLNGLPIAITHSPSRSLSESPNLTDLSFLSVLIRNTARSTFLSVPSNSALMREPSLRMTVISSASAITWLLVTTMPSASMMKPEPSELTRRGGWLVPCWLPPPPWPRRLKKSRNSSSNCGSLGSCGGCWAWLRASTFCEVEMLTTASITCSATSAILSGPRASEGDVSAGRTSAEKATAANAGLRTCRVNRASVPSMDFCAPGEVDAGTVLPSGRGRKGSLDPVEQGPGLGRNSGPGGHGRVNTKPASTTHQPDQDHSQHGGHDAGDAERSFRACQRVRRKTFRGPREGGENEPLDGKHQTDRHDEFGHVSSTGMGGRASAALLFRRGTLAVLAHGVAKKAE